MRAPGVMRAGGNRRAGAIGVLALLGMLPACSTPPEVKGALTSLGESYQQNRALARQHERLMQAVERRTWLLMQEVRESQLLALALRYALEDPGGSPMEVKLELQDFFVEDRTGPPRWKPTDLSNWLNRHRLAGLAAVGEEPLALQAGAAGNTRRAVLEALPLLAQAVRRQVNAELKHGFQQVELAGSYDAYDTNVGVLARSHQIIQEYLEVDVTVQRQDVQDISAAIRSLDD